MDLHAFFRQEVKPALGCTEPGAVALAAAAAAAELPGRTVERIHLRLSPNVFKNGNGVGVPGSGGLRGNKVAAALGALAGDAARGLQVLESVADEDVRTAQELLTKNAVSEEYVADVPNVYAEVVVAGGGHEAVAIVSGRHDLIAEVRLDHKVLHRAEETISPQGRPQYIEELMRQDMTSLWTLASSIDAELEKFLLEGVQVNMKVASLGLASPAGLGVGYTLRERALDEDLLWKVKASAGAAADVRMGGASEAVMSSAGSGNHGITAIVPIAVVGKDWHATDRQLAEAIALSHLVTGFIKAFTGRLTPVCGCSIAAGSGATAGIVRLAGGQPRQAERAVASLVSSMAGMLCDGAKGSCALKVSTAAGEAYISALLALAERGVQERQGIVSTDLRETAKAVGTLSSLGFAAVDSVILQIMQQGC